ncbi:DUF2188 domain-containing protein [Flavobacterium terrigena]|uniref:DUF2188 domain-containing protein n=1 Tax=Flavobacterium terrigena TaxID=402734 RepID=A0A1H6QFJ7_9FLAO|nr:hypothetical protein [Flavobacterium terrigena]SEI42489.1 hypothetical protein SAMN05660918_0492 [Flavobacterium terrigena]
MPWSKKNYPNAMKNLSVKVRNKAIQIANAILRLRKLGEGSAIAIGISKAKEYIAKRSRKQRKK